MDEGSLGGLSKSGQETFSIIIPVFRDRASLEVLLEDLCHQTLTPHQILVCGVAGDDSLENLKHHSSIKLLLAPKASRGLQMNMGAQAATGTFLFFLHADSRLSERDFFEKNLAVMVDNGAGNRLVAGHCRLEFQTSGAKHFNYRYYEEKTTLSRPLTINGDQGLLIGREQFWKLGGFDQRFGFLEDQFIAQEIFHQNGTWVLLPGKIQTSARRFEEEGLFKRMFLNALIMDIFLLEWWDFITEAKALYRPREAKVKANQRASLAVAPFLALLAKMLWRDPHGLQKLYRGCGYVKDQLWQVFFYFDVLWKNQSRDLLTFYDQKIHPRLQGPFWGWLAVAVVSVALSAFYAVFLIHEQMEKWEEED